MIPVWNEEKNVWALTERLDLALRGQKIDYELIFIDDHSTDKTCQIIKSLAKRYPLSHYLKKGNKGKAHSLLEGFTYARYNLIGVIDGDLQYPPEAIPQMMAKIKAGADIVVANRQHYQDSRFRKILSKGFRLGFGKFVFGLNHDIQAGLKVFKKEVLGVVELQLASGWAFDLEFLHKANEAGFKIENQDIVFHPRAQGRSKVKFLKTAWELGVSALQLRTKRIGPQHIPPRNTKTMLGAGVGYRKQRYITHTILPHHKSAIQTVVFEQKVFIILVLLALVAGFVWRPLAAATVVVAVLSFIYFIDVFFNLILIVKSLHFPQEISLNREELDNLDKDSLPTYSILCPLYREADVLPQFLEAIAEIDWSKEKLDLLLLLEEDDQETIEALEKINLPFYVRKIIVPHSLPKTKPKACNYGLSKAKGEYLVIYDAEDIPDPLQLKKAYLGFQKVPKDVVCLQAKLNYYNPHQNLLTRLFTAEYSLWFDITLTGLQSVNTSIPLGGTSNHFRRKDLLALCGWDPFNVTEDADLGVRLFKDGYKTAMIDSTTLEEANSKLANWLRQRSRWIKGYMQTYLVHMRDATSFMTKETLHSLIFQLTIGGKIAFILINPFLWLATISYFALYAQVGPTIESLYPTPVFYMAAFSLVFGNFMFLYYYMIGVVKRQQWSLVKYIFLVPFYWLAISIGGFIALYQLLFKPHYWEKTVHGFHLRKLIPPIVVGTEEMSFGYRFPNFVHQKLLVLIARQQKYLTGFLLIVASFVANFLNFLFNAYLGRVVNLADFALINLAGGFLSLSSITFGAFGTTVNYRGGFLIGKFGDDALAYRFWRYIRRKSFYLAIILTLIWLAASPALAKYFKTDEVLLFILFSALLLTRFAASADRGFLSAKLMFLSLAVLTVFEPVIKLVGAYLLVQFQHPHLTYAAVPISVLATFALGWILIIKQQSQVAQPTFRAEIKEVKHFPYKFFFVSILSGLSTMSFLGLDIILAKHFLTPDEAGRYALVSLAGKMIYFLGGLSSQFVIPLVSRNEGANKSSQKTFSLILYSTLALSLLGFVSFGLLGRLTVPFLYGSKAYSITSYLFLFSFAMMCFAVSKVFVSYYLAKRLYSFSVVAFLLTIVQFALINLYHESVEAIVFVMFIVGCLNFISMGVMHLGLKFVKVFERNFVDFLGLFSREKELARKFRDKYSILIFNWRDTKHVWAGGAEVYIHEIAKRWVKDGLGVTVFCGNDGKNAREEKVDGVEVIRRGGFYFVYIWAFFYYLLRFRGKYDVIIDCENGLPFFTPLYANERKFLLIHHVHQEVFRKSLARPFSQIASFLEKRIMPLVYRNIQVITVSESSKKEIMEHKLTAIEPIVIYSGIDLEKFKPIKSKDKNPLVLYLGRLKYYKSLNVFIEAAKLVLEKIPQVQFIIAGEGEKKKDLMALAKKLNLEDKIRFLGKVTEEEKVRLYQRAWVFINPSLIEGWGITTIEANACGVPVIASDVAGLRDSVRNPHTGLLLSYGKSHLFAEKICQLISDKKLRLKISQNAIAWAQEFSWEKSAKLFYRVITG